MKSSRIEPIEERMEAGRALRRSLGRAVNAGFKRAAKTPDLLSIIKATNEGRLRPLVPVKMGRMAVSPFSFFRGAAPVMAADLAPLPTSGLQVQLCGDAHVRNLGAYAAPDGQLVFDLNDFDETIAGPWEWDLKRMATSLVLAGREAGSKQARLCGGRPVDGASLSGDARTNSATCRRSRRRGFKSAGRTHPPS